MRGSRLPVSILCKKYSYGLIGLIPVPVRCSLIGPSVTIKGYIDETMERLEGTEKKEISYFKGAETTSQEVSTVPNRSLLWITISITIAGLTVTLVITIVIAKHSIKTKKRISKFKLKFNADVEHLSAK